jgi:precorrin-3B C17-methyltransferase
MKATTSPATAPIPSGKLYICGLGPGDESLLTPQAEVALERSDIILGYKTYVDLLPPRLLVNKEVLPGYMGGEVERCSAALQAAETGRQVCLVSSGDAGIYGMAGLTLELAEARSRDNPDYIPPDIEIIPGVPALCAAAALLGAPLTHDFAVISLSDFLTPWELIEKRLRAAAQADFVLVLYNPSSKGRGPLFRQAWSLLRSLCGDTRPCGLVREAFRSEQQVYAGQLANIKPDKVDMLSILLIGNSHTRLHNGRLITSRGYSLNKQKN